MNRIYKYFLTVGVLMGFVLWIFWPSAPEQSLILEQKETTGETMNDSNVQGEVMEESQVYVDVKGFVQNPGVYKMDDGSRVKDVIDQAGGLTEGGDPYSVNLAMKLVDEMVIHVQGKGESEVHLSGGMVSDKINVNKASVKELQSLPGVGEAKAKAIIRYKEENGPFRKIDDLLKVSGIGAKTLEGFKDKIQVP